jgi:hypothetical protein
MANINIAQIIQESLTAAAPEGEGAPLDPAAVNESAAGESIAKYMGKAKAFASNHKAGLGAAAAGAGALGAAGLAAKKMLSKPAPAAAPSLMDKAKGMVGDAKAAAAGAAGNAKAFANSHRGAVAGTTLAAIGAGVGAKALLRHLRKKKKAA